MGVFGTAKLNLLALGAMLSFGMGSVMAQVTKIVPIQEDFQIQQNFTQTVSVKGKRFESATYRLSDTFNLPFFEDFSEKGGFPNPKRWCDNQVWVNNTFGVGAPNFNVATFDHLNSKGRPYSNLDKTKMVFADSLTSQAINLKYYRQGANTYPYKPADNVYLSFFYQAQGLGDNPESEDSLLLFFKNKFGEWKEVWSVGGQSTKAFEEVFIPINIYDFFTEDFQFRFVNYTKSTGNLNHWHLDYVRLDKNRVMGSQDIQDVGILSVNDGLLKDYQNVPYSHYKNNKAAIKGNGPSVLVKNLNQLSSVQTRFALNVENRFGNTIFTQLLGASARNILPLSDTLEKFNVPLFDTLSTNTPSLKYKFLIAPQANDVTPDNYDAETNNNAVEMTHEFMPWYAYDDGSAEGGFGLDYAYLGNIKGQFAMEFNTLQDDSLRGLSMYFTQTNTDVSYRTFKLRIWRKLSPLSSPDNRDELIYEQEIPKPSYRDSINLFEYFFFDSAIFLPKGTYYAGWIQNMPYVLNVGYDNNYRFNGPNDQNPHLFYNLLGSWERADYSVKGTPMIRMMFGERVDYSFSTQKLAKAKVNVFPNPAHNVIQIFPSSGTVLKTEITDLSGRIVMQHGPQFGQTFDISGLTPGVYVAKVYLTSGQIGSAQFFKN